MSVAVGAIHPFNNRLKQASLPTRFQTMRQFLFILKFSLSLSGFLGPSFCSVFLTDTVTFAHRRRQQQQQKPDKARKK